MVPGPRQSQMHNDDNPEEYPLIASPREPPAVEARCEERWGMDRRVAQVNGMIPQ